MDKMNKKSAKIPSDALLRSMLIRPVLWMDQLRSAAISLGARHTSVTPAKEVIEWVTEWLGLVPNTSCIYCDGPTRKGSLVLSDAEGDQYAHHKCHAEACK